MLCIAISHHIETIQRNLTRVIHTYSLETHHILLPSNGSLAVHHSGWHDSTTHHTTQPSSYDTTRHITKQHHTKQYNMAPRSEAQTLTAEAALRTLTADAIAAALANSSKLSKVSKMANSMCVGSRGLHNKYLWKYTRNRESLSLAWPRT